MLCNKPILLINLNSYLSVLCKGFEYEPLDARRKRDIEEEEDITVPYIRTSKNKGRGKRQAEETEEEILQRSYGSKLGYECGLARKFEDPETQDLYSERWINCNWNKTWTPIDTLDKCVWTQCINPPQVNSTSIRQ